MPWHHLYVDHPTTAYNVSTTAANAAMAIMMATRNNDVAVFSNQDIEGGTNFYFSPAAASAASIVS